MAVDAGDACSRRWTARLRSRLAMRRRIWCGVLPTSPLTVPTARAVQVAESEAARLSGAQRQDALIAATVTLAGSVTAAFHGDRCLLVGARSRRDDGGGWR